MNKTEFRIYRGIVVNNDDPKKGGRVQVRIFELHGMSESATPGLYPVTSGEKDTKYNQIQESDLPWAEVMQSIDYIGYYPAPSDGSDEFANNIDGKGSKSAYKTITRSGKYPGFGYNVILTPGTWVFCVLDNNNPNLPIVIGCVAADNEMHKNTKPKNTRIYDSITGHYEEWSDEDGNIIFHHRTGTTITMNKVGEMTINTVKNKKEYTQENNLIHVDGEQNEYVKKDVNEKYDANHNLNVKSNEKLEVGSNRTRNVGGNEDIKISGNQKIAVSGNHNLNVSDSSTITAGPSITMSAGVIKLN